MSQCCALEVKAADNTQDCFNKTAASTQERDYLRSGSASTGSRTRIHTRGWRQSTATTQIGQALKATGRAKIGSLVPWAESRDAFEAKRASKGL